MALSPGTMGTHTQSWAAVEEKLQMDVAIWKSEAGPESRPKEYRELIEGAFIKLMDRGMAIISIGNLEWEVTPPSVYMGYCEKQDDWLMVSGSGFRVALRSPHRRGGLQVCPCSEDMPSAELNDLLTRFFTSEETGMSTTPTLQRTMSQKKRAEIIGKNFGPPYARCVNDLQNTTGISDVLDILLGFSAVYVSNQQVLQQVPEESEFEDCYFYDKEDTEEELRVFYAKKRNASLWVRQQVRDAAMKCQAAAEATSEVSMLGVEMLLSMHAESSLYDNTLRGRYASDMLRISQIFQKGKEGETHNYSLVVDNTSNSETNAWFNLNSNSNSGLHIGNVPRNDNPASSASNPSDFSLQNDLNETGENGINPCNAFLHTPSFGSGWQSDTDNDTFSETSWDFVQAQTNASTNDSEDEDDVLGAGITDADSLDMMLRDRDPCGSSDCSNLINEFLNLNLSSKSSTDQEVDGQETPKSCVLKRLASWSSSNSGWPDSGISSSDPPVSTKIRTVQLETLAEEPACDPETTRLCAAFIGRAAAKGDVLQWCSIKFNKSRSSIELRFQVASFMDDDISTLSTGIVRGSPLRVEIFLGSDNMRQSLLEGNVRISVDQGVSTEVTGTPPVVGLSCYIPHLVRQYLKHHNMQEQSSCGYKFPNGELLTGLMKHVVVKLVFLKHSCCVCDNAAYPDPIISFIPGPCEQNLCQALHEAWLVVAPRMVLEQTTIEYWLRTCFKQGNTLDEDRMLDYMDHPVNEWVRTSNYLDKLSLVVKWLRRKTLRGSWLTIVYQVKIKTDEELNYRARLLAIESEFQSRHSTGNSQGYTLQRWSSSLRDRLYLS